MAEQKKLNTILILDAKKDRHDTYHRSLSSFKLFITDNHDDFQIQAHNGYHQLMIIHHDHNTKTGLNSLNELDPNVRKTTPILLVVEGTPTQEILNALKKGASDIINAETLNPHKLLMSVKKAIEQKKWEHIYQNIAKKNKAQSQGLRDALTGTFNMVYFETRLKEELKRSQRYSFPLSMLLFNIEGFKGINDEYGFDVGDVILKDVCQTLKQNLRSADLLARLKDDYFALLLPHTQQQNALKVWERISNQIAKTPFSVKQLNLYITLRGAVVTLNQDSMALENVLEKMDDNREEAQVPSLLSL